RAAHPERNRAGAQLDARAGHALRADLRGNTPAIGREQLLYRVLRSKNAAGALRNQGARRRVAAEAHAARGKPSDRIRGAGAAAAADPLAFPGGDAETGLRT